MVFFKCFRIITGPPAADDSPSDVQSCECQVSHTKAFESRAEQVLAGAQQHQQEGVGASVTESQNKLNVSSQNRQGKGQDRLPALLATETPITSPATRGVVEIENKNTLGTGGATLTSDSGVFLRLIQMVKIIKQHDAGYYNSHSYLCQPRLMMHHDQGS